MYRKGKAKSRTVNLVKDAFLQDLKNMDSLISELVAKKTDTALEIHQINWEIVETGLPFYLKYRDLLSQGSIKKSGLPEDTYLTMLQIFLKAIERINEAAIELMITESPHSGIFQLSAPLDIHYNQLPVSLKFQYLVSVNCLNKTIGSSAHAKFCAERFIEIIQATKLKKDKYKIEYLILQCFLLYFSLQMHVNPKIECNEWDVFWNQENFNSTNMSFDFLEQRFLERPFARNDLLFVKNSCIKLTQAFNYFTIFNTAYYNKNNAFNSFIKKINTFKMKVEKQMATHLNGLIKYHFNAQGELARTILTAEECFAKSVLYQQKTNYPLSRIKTLSDEELKALQNILKLAVNALKKIQGPDLALYTYKIQIQAVQCLKQYIAISCHFEINNKFKDLDKYTFYSRYNLSFEEVRLSTRSELELLGYDLHQLNCLLLKCFEFDLDKIRNIFEAFKTLTKELICRDSKKLHLLDTVFYPYVIIKFNQFFESLEADIIKLPNSHQYLTSEDQSQLTAMIHSLEILNDQLDGDILEQEILYRKLQINLRLFKLQGLDTSHEKCRTEVISYLTKAFKMNAGIFLQDPSTYALLKDYNIDCYDYNQKLFSVKNELKRQLINNKEIRKRPEIIVSLLTQFCNASFPEWDLDISIDSSVYNIIDEILPDFIRVILQKIYDDYGSKMQGYFADIFIEFIKIIYSTDPAYLPKRSVEFITNFILEKRSQTLEQLILVERLNSNAFRIDETIAYCLLYINQPINCVFYDNLVKIYCCLFESLSQKNDYTNAVFYIDSALERMGFVDAFVRIKTRIRVIQYKDQITKIIDDILQKTLDGFFLISNIKASDFLSPPTCYPTFGGLSMQSSQVATTLNPAEVEFGKKLIGYDPHCLDKYMQEKVFAYEEYNSLEACFKKIEKSHQLLLTAIKIFKEYTSIHSQGILLIKKTEGLSLPNIQATPIYPFQTTPHFYRALIDTTAIDNLTIEQINTINKVCDLLEEKTPTLISTSFVWNPSDIINNIEVLIQQIKKRYDQFRVEANGFNDALMQYEQLHHEKKLAYTSRIEAEKKLEQEKKSAILKIKQQDLNNAMNKEQSYQKIMAEKKGVKEKKIEEMQKAKELVAISKKILIKFVEEESVSKRIRSKLNFNLIHLEKLAIEENLQCLRTENNINILSIEQNYLEQTIKESKKTEEKLTYLIAILGGTGPEIQVDYFTYLYTLQKQLQCKILLKGSLIIRLAILHFNNNSKLAAAYPITNDIDLTISTQDLDTLKHNLEGLDFRCIKITQSYHKFQKIASPKSPIIYDLTTEGPGYHSEPFLPLQMCSGIFVDLDEVSYEEAKAQGQPVVNLGPHYILLQIKKGYENTFENAIKFREFIVKKPNIGYLSYCYILYKMLVKFNHCKPNINLDYQFSEDNNFIPFNEALVELKKHFLILFESKKKRILPYIELMEFVNKGIIPATEKFAKPIITVFFEALILFRSAGRVPQAVCSSKSKEAASNFIENLEIYKTENGIKLIELINILSDLDIQVDNNLSYLSLNPTSLGFFYGNQYISNEREDLSLSVLKKP